ncbi:hypothetical protein FGB62_20g02 [Gracilaria domingensis]|nr:hypothetical protein FGB62_20g02 [Gracilaria domingensis]
MATFAPGKEVERYGDPRVCTKCNNKDEIPPGRAQTPKPYTSPPNSELVRLDTNQNRTRQSLPSVANPSKVVRVDEIAHAEDKNDYMEVTDKRGQIDIANDDEQQEDSTDSDFTCGSDNDCLISSDDENGGAQPYAWVDVSLRSKDVGLEIDDVENFSTGILIDETTHILRKFSEPLGVASESLIKSPPSPRRIFEIFFNSNVLNAFAEAGTFGLRQTRSQMIGNGQVSYTMHDIMHYFQALMMCGVYDASPAEILDRNIHKIRYETQEIRSRISFQKFKDIRKGLTTSLGNENKAQEGISTLQWINKRFDIPASLNVLEQAVACVSSDICLRPGTGVLGLDDDQLRFASRYHKHLPLKPGDGKKVMGLHATSMTSTLTGPTAALHNSSRGEKMPEVFASVLMLSMRTSNPRIAAELLSGQLSQLTGRMLPKLCWML